MCGLYFCVCMEKLILKTDNILVEGDLWTTTDFRQVTNTQIVARFGGSSRAFIREEGANSGHTEIACITLKVVGAARLHTRYSTLNKSHDCHDKEDNDSRNSPGFTGLGCDANHAAGRGEEEHYIGYHGPLGAAQVNPEDLVNNQFEKSK